MSGFLNLLTRLRSKSDRLVGVEAARCFRELAEDLQLLGVAPPELPTLTRDALSHWILGLPADLVRSAKPLAKGERTGRGPSSSRRPVRR